MIEARLLAGLRGERVTYAEHCAVHGPALRVHGPELRRQLETAQLRGRGGGAFPLIRKLDAVARNRAAPVLVVNGCEGEPMSGKDRVLLRYVPQLVLDGTLAIAEVIGAERIIVALDRFDFLSLQSLERALRERADGASCAAVEPVEVPEGYVTGQETALVNWLNGGEPRPRMPWPRVTDRGVGGRPTLVSNVETLAHVGLIARHGIRWFEEVGLTGDPGTTLVTLAGAVVSPGVYEIEHGSALTGLLHQAGGPAARLSGALIGGYAGAWIGPDQLRSITLDHASLHRAGTRLGAGVIVLLGAEACPVAETARVADWMAAHSAGQCGPCRHGLGAVADALQDVYCGRDGRRALADVARWTGQIPGRGACAHPDGAVMMVASALRVFRASFLAHAGDGRCDACGGSSVLATPGLRSAVASG